MDNFLVGLIISVIILIVGAFALGVYFLPILIAWSMHSQYLLPIFLLNLFAGWTGLGWLGALIWAVIR